MELLIILGILGLWIGVGCMLFLIYGRSPQLGSRTLTRGVGRRLYLVGDQVQVNLGCSNTGLPSVSTVKKSTPWDIVLVIDHSSSMGAGVGSALEEAKQAAINLVRTTPRSFRFAIVEFDHDAREICPLTKRGRGLIRALQSIGGGGATDIALGLRVAGQCLKDVDMASRKRAIILLSDGESASDSALTVAQEIKDRDNELTLITIGLGASDMDLLRKLASTPDCCYQADQLEELRGLYMQIGQMMAGQQISDVQVSECFNNKGPWGLRAWGELQPAQRILKEGEFTWLLATLEETPTELSYSLESLCPGWHPVALEPAVLRAKLADGGEHETQSNQGPRLLVLPRLPGWQLWWLILNPLFFILFGRWFCRKEGVLIESPVLKKPALQPLKLPPLLTPPPPAAGPLPLRPSLIVGLGYGGTHALVHCKRLLWERERRADESKLRFLAVDTASEEFFPTPNAGVVSLVPQERLHLEQPLEPLLANATDPWLPARLLQAGGARPDLQRGTGHQRVLGRLAMVTNRPALEQRLRSLLQELLAQSDTNEIDILVTGTGGGGTASGGILELCWLLRRLLHELGSAGSTSLFLMAPVAKEEPMDMASQETRLRLQNNQALLLELDRVAALRSEPLAPVAGEQQVRRWFDRVFCIGPVGNIGQDRWFAQRELYPRAGEVLFNWLGSEDFRNHFKSLDVKNNDLTQVQGRCFVHRLEPYVYFLYPRTLVRYLVVDSLRRYLAKWFWDLQEGMAVPYAWHSHRPAIINRVRDCWLQQSIWEGDFPWVFTSLDMLSDHTRLHENLVMGAGPGISAGVSPLQRSEYLTEQRELTRALLDVWVSVTLNDGLADGCEPHALSAVMHVLKDLGESLIKGARLARDLEEQSQSPLIREEAALLAELASQAAAESGAVLTHLGGWDRLLGEGINADTIGLLRYLDVAAGRLQGEMERLMGLTQENRTSWPSLPMNWTQVETLRSQSCDPDIPQLLSRVRWDIHREGVKPVLDLYLQGTDTLHWTGDLVSGGKQIITFAETLIQTGIHLLPHDRWQLKEWVDPTLLANPESIPPPRSDGINPGASSVCLVQENSLLKLPSHIRSEPLVVMDPQENRAISCEQNLSSQWLWPLAEEGRLLPFVFNEEFYAYKAYDTYCREQDLIPEILSPILVGLCRTPDALLTLALVGLAENERIVSEQEDGRQWWIANLEGGRYLLSEWEEDPLTDFKAVANAWMGHEEADFTVYSNVTVEEPPTDWIRRIKAHPLLEALEDTDDGLCAQFIAIISGLLLLRGN